MPSKISIYKPLETFITNALAEFYLISKERKEELAILASYISANVKSGKKTELVFICTHNSRRSHIAQILAQTLAVYNKFENVIAYSGGTEATAFNPRAVKALMEVGFKIAIIKEGANPVYEVKFSDDAYPIAAYSKVYDAPGNPTQDFCAVMTCSHADENCPFISGAAKRIPLTYDDPKDFDDTPLETMKYVERVYQIGRELAYAFTLIK